MKVLYVCGPVECFRPCSKERRRNSSIANKIRALFQLSETCILLYICHMVLQCNSTCVLAAQYWVKKKKKKRVLKSGNFKLVYGWRQMGRIPESRLKTQNGRHRFSDCMWMQVIHPRNSHHQNGRGLVSVQSARVGFEPRGVSAVISSICFSYNHCTYSYSNLYYGSLCFGQAPLQQ